MTRHVSSVLLRLHKQGLDWFVVVGKQRRNLQEFPALSRRYLSDSNKSSNKKSVSLEEEKPSSSVSTQDVKRSNRDTTDSKLPVEASASGTSMTSNSAKSTAHATTTTVPAPSSSPQPPSSSFSIALSNFLKRLQSTLEESSGLTELVQLKQAVQEASRQFDVATQKVAECRIRVAQSQKAHEQAHKRHVTLLMRRDEWNADDAQQFVTMTSEEVMTRQALLEAQEQLRRAEDLALQCQHEYMDKMRQRYHEEQMWQDKWRLLSTYGTWSLIGINTMVFLVGQYRANRREMNRLSHMEKLLLVSQQQQSYNHARDDDDKTASTTNRDAEEEETDASVSMQQKDNDSNDGKTASDEVTTAISKLPSQHEDDNKNSLRAKYFSSRYNWKEMPIHTPSVAVGAVLGASCVFVLSLLLAGKSSGK